MKNKITGIILSGGKSIRMGKDKAFIEIGGVPIITRIQTLFERLFEEIIIVANQTELFSSFEAKIYSDLIPDRGVLGGLYTGLYYSSFQYSFCVACDMPFLKEPVIEFLLNHIGGEDVIVPKTHDGLQPLHALYSKNCLNSIKKLLEAGKNKVIDFYPMVQVKVIEEERFSSLDSFRESFVNVNTPEDLKIINI